MSVPGLRPGRAGHRAGWTLAGVALVLTGLAGAAPGRSGGSSPPATATLTVAPGSSLPPGATLALTLYFAHVGSVLLHLPVSRA